jgi:hypothetical protein
MSFPTGGSQKILAGILWGSVVVSDGLGDAWLADQ